MFYKVNGISISQGLQNPRIGGGEGLDRALSALLLAFHEAAVALPPAISWEAKFGQGQKGGRPFHSIHLDSKGQLAGAKGGGPQSNYHMTSILTGQ